MSDCYICFTKKDVMLVIGTLLAFLFILISMCGVSTFFHSLPPDNYYEGMPPDIHPGTRVPYNNGNNWFYVGDNELIHRGYMDGQTDARSNTTPHELDADDADNPYFWGYVNGYDEITGNDQLKELYFTVARESHITLYPIAVAEFFQRLIL